MLHSRGPAAWVDSVRLGWFGTADPTYYAIAHEPLKNVVLLGDLNGTMNDRALNAVTSQMRSTQGAAGNGFGFSWPASFPMARRATLVEELQPYLLQEGEPHPWLGEGMSDRAPGGEPSRWNRDKDLSFTDCTSVAVMRELRLTTVMTTTHSATSSVLRMKVG